MLTRTTTSPPSDDESDLLLRRFKTHQKYRHPGESNVVERDGALKWIITKLCTVRIVLIPIDAGCFVRLIQQGIISSDGTFCVWEKENFRKCEICVYAKAFSCEVRPID
jgi:hypothetical protein